MNFLRRILEAWAGDTADYVTAATLDRCIRQREREYSEWQAVMGQRGDTASQAWPRRAPEKRGRKVLRIGG